MTKATDNAEQPLDTMTVKQLREIAKDIPDLTGVHAMKKQDLVDAINAHRGDTAGDAPLPPEAQDDAPPAEAAKPKAAAKAKPKAAAKPKAGGKSKKVMTIAEIKQMIRELSAKKKALAGQKDRRQAEILRKQISRLKKRSRRSQ